MSEPDFDKLRQSFELQRQIVEETRKAKEGDVCEHKWEQFKQTIMSERTDRQIEQGMIYQHGNAYFILRGCTLCHEKQLIDMKVEH